MSTIRQSDSAFSAYSPATGFHSAMQENPLIDGFTDERAFPLVALIYPS
jgi:hypothetical protein